MLRDGLAGRGDLVPHREPAAQLEQRLAVALAQLVAGRHNVLLLDEPTNNLDPSSRTATGEALAAWPGTMIVVSHDVGFVRSLAPDRALLMPDGTLDYFDDDMLDLLELV